MANCLKFLLEEYHLAISPSNATFLSWHNLLLFTLIVAMPNIFSKF